MRARAGPGQLIAVNRAEDVDRRTWPASMKHRDGNRPMVAHADVEQRDVDRTEGARHDLLSHETEWGPCRPAVPFWVVGWFVGGQGFLDGTFAPPGNFVRGLDDPPLLLTGHVWSLKRPFINGRMRTSERPPSDASAWLRRKVCNRRMRQVQSATVAVLPIPTGFGSIPTVKARNWWLFSGPNHTTMPFLAW